MAKCLNCKLRDYGDRPRGLCWKCSKSSDARLRFPLLSTAPRYKNDDETMEDLNRLIEEQMKNLPKNFWETEPPTAPARWVRCKAWVLERRPNAFPKLSRVQSVDGDRYALYDGAERISGWYGDVEQAWEMAARDMGKRFRGTRKYIDRHKMKRIK